MVVYYTGRKRAPIFHFLRVAGLVESLSLFSALSSTPTGFGAAGGGGAEARRQHAREWRQQGVTLRDRGLYELAAKCFQQSGDESSRLEVLGLLARRLALGESGGATRRDLAQQV